MQAGEKRRITRPNVTPAVIERAKNYVNNASKIVVLTGAGISTDSGIPDYRGPRGVWTRNPKAERDSNIHTYVADKSTRVRSWQGKGTFGMGGKKPNSGHEAVQKIYEAGKLKRLITTNIDNLHLEAGTPLDVTIEYHGHLRECECCSCGMVYPMETAAKQLADGIQDPRCVIEACRGPLKACVVMFGETIDEDNLYNAEMDARECDLFICVGSSLQVPPSCYLPQTAKYKACAPVLIINAESTEMDHVATMKMRGQIHDILPKIVADL